MTFFCMTYSLHSLGSQASPVLPSICVHNNTRKMDTVLFFRLSSTPSYILWMHTEGKNRDGLPILCLYYFTICHPTCCYANPSTFSRGNLMSAGLANCIIIWTAKTWIEVCRTEMWVLYWRKGERGLAINVCFHSWTNPSHRQAVNFSVKCAFILVQSKLSISRVVTNMSLTWLWEWLWMKAGLDWSGKHSWLGPLDVDASIEPRI